MFGGLIGTALVGVATPPELEAFGITLFIGFFAGAPGGALACTFFASVLKLRK